jgi:hypothetical protein
MKITVHKTLKRPWGYETPYTAKDDNGEVFNGYLDNKVEPKEIDQQRIISAIDDIKARRLENEAATPEDITTLEEQKAQLEADIATLQAQKEELIK